MIEGKSDIPFDHDISTYSSIWLLIYRAYLRNAFYSQVITAIQESSELLA